MSKVSLKGVMYASRCRENVRGAGNQSVPCVLSGLRLKSLSILRCWNVYFRGGGQRNQDLLESGHTITPAAKNSLPHPCPCAVEDMPAADSDGLTTLPRG